MNIQPMIAHFYTLKAQRITYSMFGSRTGADGTGDCSGVLYAALVKGGASKANYPPSTETLHAYLLKNQYHLVAENRHWSPQTGDIFIWGKKGQSAFSGGHTGLFIDTKRVIHCNYSQNGISIDAYQTIDARSGHMYPYAYRLKNAPPTLTRGGKLIMKTYTLNRPITLLTKPSAKGALIARLRKGDIVRFDNIIVAEGKLWACQPRATGYGYIEIGALIPHGVIT